MKLKALFFVTTAVLCAADPYKPTADEISRMRAKLAELKTTGDPDIDVYRKAAEWILRYAEEFYTKTYAANTLKVLDEGLARARQKDEHPWRKQKGRLVRGYRSRVDGSVQPYALIIPETYDGSKPVRLDLVLHGRGATLNEVSFIAAHEGTAPVQQDYITVEVFGRTNNAYRWSGETDVFEALEAVQREYKIDPDRIVLRGFSMGGAGAWHLGLHHPSQWVAFEAGAGFTETKRYAKKPDLPPVVQATLHIYDAVDYSLNGWDVPFVGYGGEIDPQLQASVNIKEQLAKEGLKPGDLRALFLVGPQTAHKFHPESKKTSDALLDKAVAEGRHAPSRIRFVTYTTRYNECFGVRVDGLEKHYDRAEVDASNGVVKTLNVARLHAEGAKEIDGQKVKGSEFEKVAGKWRAAGHATGLRKTHGLQGPIDDAFMDAFVCVRPSSGSRILDRFTEEYAKYFRADVPVKSASEVTPDDIANRNLILFGDASTNPLIAKIAGKLPIRAGAGETLAMIYPNPLNPKRYVVLNSGHTFHAADLRGTNALLFPRLGDWAILNADGSVKEMGLFDEEWKKR